MRGIKVYKISSDKVIAVFYLDDKGERSDIPVRIKNDFSSLVKLHYEQNPLPFDYRYLYSQINEQPQWNNIYHV